MPRFQRIGFAGASGTGKSTLATYLAETLALPQCPIGSRSVAAEMGFKSPYEVDALGLRKRFQEILRAKKGNWEIEHDAFVTDRTMLDNYVYAILHSGIDLGWSPFQGMQRYDVVFYCGIDAFQDLGDDSARMHNDTYHRVYDACLHGLLSEVCTKLGVPLEYVDAGTLDERKSFVLEVVS